MNNFKMMLFNALVLIVLGIIVYVNAETKSPTALIPIIAGAILLILSIPTRNGNKIAAHIGVVLTLLIAIALIMPIRRTGNVYIVAMCIISFIAFVYYVIGFIKRKKELKS
ncbi:MAG TPA: hypothetical protein PLG90_02590 [Ignavibacteria bacterium]|nr:hypothetical protein [Ignavibacteria bacterium]